MIRSNFSPWEIDEVKKLSGSMSKDALASHFGISPYVFDKLRKKQPELERAFQDGRKDSKFPKVKRFHESGINSKPHHRIIAPEDPWVEFQKKFAQDKKERALRELKNPYDW